ncbi:TPA: hypothetical protein ACFBWM_002007 [Neisseria gonorrhoeae]
MLRGIPSAAGAPQTAGFGKPPDPAPAGLPVGKPLWPDAMYRVTALFYPCALIHGTAVFGNPQPFARPAIAACAAMAGRGGGILQVAATFPNNSTAQIQALRLVALSPALSHRERGRGGCWG